MTDNKRHYWGIVKRDKEVVTGTFKEVWDEFVRKYSKKTVKELVDEGIKIKRIG